MEVGCLKYPGASTIGSQPLDWNNAPMTGTTAQPGMRMPKTAVLGTQALLVVNSFKLHLNSSYKNFILFFCTFIYCSCKQETKEQYWEQQFRQKERDTSVQLTEMTRPVKEDHLQSWSRIFQSDQTEWVCSIWCSNQNFSNFGLNGKRPFLFSIQEFPSKLLKNGREPAHRP